MTQPATLVRDTVAVLTGRRRIFYGWWILVSSAAGLGLVNGISFWSFGLFIQPVEDQFGWSRADVSLGISLSLLVAGLAAPVAGWCVDRFGPRASILAGAAGTAATYALLATTHTLWQWQLFMALNGLVRHLIFLIPFMALVSRWFDRRRSFAVGVTASGLMLGGMVMVPVMQQAIDWFRWNGAFLFVAVVTIGVYVPLALFVIRDNPADIGETVDGAGPVASPSADEDGVELRGVTLGAATRSRVFWAFVAGDVLFASGMSTWIVHSVPFYQSIGFSEAWAVGLTSLTAGLGMGSRIVAGHLADRLPRLEYGAVGVGLFLASSMLVFLVSTSPFAVPVFLLLFVTGFGGGGALMITLLLTRAFGVAHFATILGTVMVIETLGLLIGPTAAGAIFDATGSYHWALVMLATVFTLSAASFFVASRLPRPLDALATRRTPVRSVEPTG